MLSSASTSAPQDSGPAYADFPQGRPLTGTVTTRAGRRLAGRLVYELDESETTETLDAPSHGVDYTIPFGMVASIVPAGREEHDARRARVTLHSGEELQLERAGDLGEGISACWSSSRAMSVPRYVQWTEIVRIDFNPPPLMYPPLKR